MDLYESRSKRPRDIDFPSLPPSDVVRRLNQAVTSEQRLSITTEVLDYLKSQNHAVFYDQLLHAGITHTMCLQLGFIFNRSGRSMEEVENISRILNQIYKKCTVEARCKSISDIGPELFKLLLKGMAYGVLLPILSLLHICSSYMQGTCMLLECRVIHAIAEVTQNKKLDDQLLMEILGLLKNLSYFGEERRHELVEHGVLMSRLARIACTSGTSEKTLERISAIYRNLAVVSPSTRPLLAQNTKTLGATVRLGSTANRQIHRNVLNFLLSLSQELDSCMVICLYGDGMILSLLKRLMMVENDSITRKRAVRVLRLLACDSSGSLIAHDSAILSSLAQRALRDISNEVRTEATDALVRLAAFVRSPMPQHSMVLDALTQLCSSPTAQPAVLALAFMKQAARPENRVPMVERQMLVESLAQIAMSMETTNAAKEHACCAILDLTKEGPSRDRIATCSILEALMLNSKSRQETQHPCYVFGIKALINLAAAHANRKAMVNHRRLLQTLVQYAASSTDDDLKEDVKKTILTLVVEL